MDNCIFCKIVNKEISSYIIYENDSAIAMLDINPISLGHSVVIPKRHISNIFGLKESEYSDIFSAIKTCAEIIDKKLNPDGFTIGINHGKVSGQAIDHLHVHIIPRYNGDGGGSMHSIVHNPPKEPVKDIFNKLI